MQKIIFYLPWLLLVGNSLAAIDALARSIWKLIKFSDFGVHVPFYLLIISLGLSLLISIALFDRKKYFTYLIFLPPIILFICKK